MVVVKHPVSVESPPSPRTVSVAIPVKNGGRLLGRVLDAVLSQVLEPPLRLEIVVCDSGSTDGSLEVAQQAGAKVLSIPSEEFSHSGTRNLLMSTAEGDHVAFLTQDAVPAAPTWLQSLLDGFRAGPGVGLVFGPYLARPGASLPVRRELEHWFRSLAPDGSTRVDRLAPEERDLPAARLYGPRTFFTDANGCLSRAAWEQVPFRRVSYAEDHALAQDMLRAGFAKVFVPGAGVVHSHDYRGWEWVRRSFDEARAVREVYELDRGGDLRQLMLSLRGGVSRDIRYGGSKGTAALPLVSLRYHLARSVGTALGNRSEHLPPWLVRRLSLESRS